MENGRFDKPPFWQRDRFWLTATTVGLSLMTVIVGIAIYFFVASLALVWQSEPEPVVAAAVSSDAATNAVVVDRVVDGGETAVLPTPTMPMETAVPTQAASVIAGFAPSIEPDREQMLGVEPVETAVPSIPYLIIPSLGVTQTIDAVPIVDGQWDISGLSTQVGLLDSTGTHPGDAYAMTFIGHVTLPWPGIGPFADLILLEHGEEVIYRLNGTDYIYQVERIFRADPRAVDLLYVPDGEKIVLVTCSGWDFVGREYDERLVTRAVFVRAEPSPTIIQ